MVRNPWVLEDFFSSCLIQEDLIPRVHLMLKDLTKLGHQMQGVLIKLVHRVLLDLLNQVDPELVRRARMHKTEIKPLQFLSPNEEVVHLCQDW